MNGREYGLTPTGIKVANQTNNFRLLLPTIETSEHRSIRRLPLRRVISGILLHHDMGNIRYTQIITIY